MHKGTLLRVPYHDAMHYHNASALLLLHLPTSTLDQDARRPSLRSNWMHKGTLLRVPHYNASTHLTMHNRRTRLTMHNRCGRLAMHNPRDAFVLCTGRGSSSEDCGYGEGYEHL